MPFGVPASRAFHLAEFCLLLGWGTAAYVLATPWNRRSASVRRTGADNERS